jgi:hypothetical protein
MSRCYKYKGKRKKIRAGEYRWKQVNTYVKTEFLWANYNSRIVLKNKCIGHHRLDLRVQIVQSTPVVGQVSSSNINIKNTSKKEN